MTMEPRDKTLFASAAAILRDNDRGAYTVPTKGLYPFQWNWDSCLTALGQRHFDEQRAWTEIATLLTHQWPDGMVPGRVTGERLQQYVDPFRDHFAGCCRSNCGLRWIKCDRFSLRLHFGIQRNVIHAQQYRLIARQLVFRIFNCHVVTSEFVTSSMTSCRLMSEGK